MKLQVPEISCGGPNGCGMVFAFPDGTTVADARQIFTAHRADVEHPTWVEQRKIRDRMVREMIGRKCRTPECDKELDPKNGAYCLECWRESLRAWREAGGGT